MRSHRTGRGLRPGKRVFGKVLSRRTGRQPAPGAIVRAVARAGVHHRPIAPIHHRLAATKCLTVHAAYHFL